MAATRPRKRICPLSRIIAPPSERLLLIRDLTATV
jgi:hypothetical protein